MAAARSGAIVRAGQRTETPLDPRPEPPPEDAGVDPASDENLMRRALRLARTALDEGEVPVGAVICLDRRILGSAWNQVEGLRDATAHAEILAITQASAALGDWRLEGARLVVTKEPCPMCAGAIVKARIAEVVYGAPDPREGGNTVFRILDWPDSNHRVAVRGGVLEEQAASLLRSFFQGRRQVPKE